MRKGFKIILFVGLGVLALGLIISVVAFALNGFRFVKSEVQAENSDIKSFEINRVIDEDISDISIELVTADVDIVRSSDGKCRLDFSYRGVAEESDFELIAENGTLAFRQKTDSKSSWLNVKWGWERLVDLMNNRSYDNEGKLILYLPEKGYGKLNVSVVTGDVKNESGFGFSNAVISAVTGDIMVSDLDCSGSVEITATTGDIQLSGIHADGNVSIEVTTGDISIKDSEFAEGDIADTTGDILIEYLEAEKLDVAAVSGDITGIIDSQINVICETVSGSCNAPSGSKGRWEISTVSGDIDLKGVQIQ